MFRFLVGRIVFLLVTVNALVLPYGRPASGHSIRPPSRLRSSPLPTIQLSDGIHKDIFKLGDTSNGRHKNVIINYEGVIGELYWTPDEVIQCWLSTLQGQEDLVSVFREHGIDSQQLLSHEYFTEDFVVNQLGVTNKIKAKKLVMAAKRLQSNVRDFPVGTVFDANTNYAINFEKSTIIRGMTVGISSMSVGEQCRLVLRCDAAYGSEGLRRRDGDVMVPPYATLCFLMTLCRVADD